MALEINLFKANAQETKTEVAWVHSGSMLANSPTKTTEPQQLDLFYSRRCCWRITYDPEFWSAKRRQAAGIAPLDDRPGMLDQVHRQVQHAKSGELSSVQMHGLGSCAPRSGERRERERGEPRTEQERTVQNALWCSPHVPHDMCSDMCVQACSDVQLGAGGVLGVHACGACCGTLCGCGVLSMGGCSSRQHTCP